MEEAKRAAKISNGVNQQPFENSLQNFRAKIVCRRTIFSSNHNVQYYIIIVFLTRIDQILIGDTGMIHVMDGGGEECRKHLCVILKIRATM